MKQDNEKYCIECGVLINIKAEICPKCGVRQQLLATPLSAEIVEQRNKWITCLLLCWFLGVLGVHRFYTGLGIFRIGIWYQIHLRSKFSSNL